MNLIEVTRKSQNKKSQDRLLFIFKALQTYVCNRLCDISYSNAKRYTFACSRAA